VVRPDHPAVGLRPRNPGKDVSKTKYVFPGRAGEERVNVYHHAKILKAAAKLPASFRMFHGCRHHFASTLASAGVDLYTVAVLLTHKTGSVTSRYAHLADATLRAATNIMGNKWREMERRCIGIVSIA
jgi:site-specific recombinase XerD